MNYVIKRPIEGGALNLATVRPEGKLIRRIMGESLVEMNFTLSNPVNFEIGDYITAYGENFQLNQLPTVSIDEATGARTFNAKFESVTFYDLGKVQCLTLGDDNSIKEGEFALMGNLEVFVDLIVLNMNRVQGGWVKGVVDATEFKNLSFSNQNCLEVLTTVVEDFKTEFWIEGKTIHATKRGAASGLTFEYGQGKGLYSLDRNNKDSSNVCTRLYVFGGSKNIPGNYRNFSSKLKLPVAVGVCIEQNIDKYGIIEHTETFEDIYPRRIGTISAVDVANIFKFTDAAMDFDVNQNLLGGDIRAKVTFNTGQLAGYTFEVSGYNHVTKQFTINKNKEEKALEVPSALLKPAVGDEFVLIDISMPQSYIDAAEAELLGKAQEYLAANSTPRVQYNVSCDPIHFKAQNISITLGDTVRVKDTPLGVDSTIRVIGLTRDLAEPFKYELEISESVKQAAIVRDMIEQEKIEKAIKLNGLTDPARARRNWRDSQELLNMVFDAEGSYYTDKIKPNSIETQMLQVGARSQQLQVSGSVFEANYQGDPNKFRSTAGVLDHFSIDTNVVSWNLQASNYVGLGNAAYYIYAKCEKGGNNATVFLSMAQITVNEDSNYYHFLLGVLHSAADNVRGISLTYGQSTMNGRFITTGQIRSQDGTRYWDVDTGTAVGSFTFLPGSTGFNNLADKPDLSHVKRHFSSQPVTPYDVGDFWTDGANIWRCKVGRLAGAFDAADWERATNYDSTQVIIDQGIVTSGTIKLGNALGTNAGVTGSGVGADQVRIWAGATYENRANAPYRVLDDGTTYMTKAFITGHINATSGTIGGFQITADGFGLNGTAIKIIPDKGISVLNGGFFTLPEGASNDPETVGKYQMYIDEVGTGGTAPNPISPVDAYSKNEINAFFGGVTSITGYNKANWDAAYTKASALESRTITINNITYDLSQNRSWTISGGNASQWVTVGSNIYYSLGSVGIKTASPSYDLDVNGSAAFRSTTYMYNSTLYAYESTTGKYFGFTTSGGIGYLGMTDGSSLIIQNAGGTAYFGNTTANLRLGTNGADYGHLYYSGGVVGVENRWMSTSAYLNLWANGKGLRIYGTGNATLDGTLTAGGIVTGGLTINWTAGNHLYFNVGGVNYGSLFANSSYAFGVSNASGGTPFLVTATGGVYIQGAGSAFLDLTTANQLQYWRYSASPTNYYLKLSQDNPVGGVVTYSFSQANNGNVYTDALKFTSGVVQIGYGLKIPAKNSGGSLTGNYYEIYVEE